MTVFLFKIQEELDGHFPKKMWETVKIGIMSKGIYLKFENVNTRKNQRRTKKIKNMGRIVDQIYHVHNKSNPTRELFKQQRRYSQLGANKEQ